MNSFLQTYDIELTTVGPLFIGSGKQLSKKEYLFQGNYNNRFQRILVLDIEKFYGFLSRKGLARQFEQYLLSGDRMDLRRWLDSNGIKQTEIKPFSLYELPCGETSLERGTSVQIMTCMKDPYGNPYIPGSSLKGMLRTLLLARRLKQKQNDFLEIKKRTASISAQPNKRPQYLRKEAGELEEKAFYTLGRTEKKNAVNDEMSGIIISDSTPVSMNDIILCQKVERHTDGSVKTLNILRECIKPGTKIHFSMTVDSMICNITKSDIEEAVREFANIYSKCFLDGFQGMDHLLDNQIILGGGAGFASKTIVYPMMGRADGVRLAQNVFQFTLGNKAKEEHKHYNDHKLGISPHIVKCTQYKGKQYQMGLCDISIKPFSGTFATQH